MNTSSLEYHLAEFKIAVSPDGPRHLQPALQNDVASILDIGCGVGQGLLSLELNDHVFACGVDIDEAALRHGKELAPGMHFVCTEGECLPFGDLSFDFVMSLVALPYMHLPKTLAEIARVVKPGGQIWFSLHPWSTAYDWLIQAIRSISLKNTLYRLYVIVNGVCFHFVGRQFRFPLARRRCESFQTVRGMRRAMNRAGFVEVRVVKPGHRFIVTAVKADC
jgi:SAM-dependent methyltransferase